mgnify:CR=1 FL=1
MLILFCTKFVLLASSISGWRWLTLQQRRFQFGITWFVTSNQSRMRIETLVIYLPHAGKPKTYYTVTMLHHWCITEQSSVMYQENSVTTNFHHSSVRTMSILFFIAINCLTQYVPCSNVSWCFTDGSGIFYDNVNQSIKNGQWCNSQTSLVFTDGAVCTELFYFNVNG